MKRQKILLISLGACFALLCAGVGYFLFSAIAEKNQAEEERMNAFDQLRAIYRGKVFPSTTNIVQLKTDEKALAAWLASASTLLHNGEIPPDNQTPSGFKQRLLDTVRQLSSLSGRVAGKISAPTFYFGFDKYLGESSSLPADTNVATRLAYQLSVIEKVCRELHSAGALEIRGVTREMFDDAASASVEEEKPREERRSRRSRRRSRDSEDAGAAPKAADAAVPSGLVRKQSFFFEFAARPDAFIKTLNKLSSMTPFTVVTRVEFNCESDSLAAFIQNRRSSDSAEKADGPASAGKKAETTSPLEKVAAAEPKRLIVTSPDLEPPLIVKLTVDVYTFEGV